MVEPKVFQFGDLQLLQPLTVLEVEHIYNGFEPHPTRATASERGSAALQKPKERSAESTSEPKQSKRSRQRYGRLQYSY